MQSVYNGLLRVHRCFSARCFRPESARVQPGQNLSARDFGPFLHQHLRDALAIVEREIYLAQIDIPIQDQSVLVLVGVSPDATESKANCDSGQNQKSDD